MTYLDKALAIGELSESLFNISADDKKQLFDYSQQEIVNEAKYILSTFYESGHNNNDWLLGEWGLDPKEAKEQVKLLKKFIKQYE
jgi:hypothetical protein